MYLPLVLVKQSHAKNCNHPANHAHHDDSDNDGHLAAANSRQDLSSDDAINGRVTNHENDIEEAQNLGWPVAHKESQNDLTTKHGGVSKYMYPKSSRD